ncbi:peptidoglycan DD-metalloendopeptidase family protein [Maribacter sp. 2308TA10-17]|uniref:peptidoglycan DD-metalloendopeptidase family protein n=1 Tax=Maribacter sp. 2308TA10-17 TaxID=3386276 RepID=UPI0039BD392A
MFSSFKEFLKSCKPIIKPIDNSIHIRQYCRIDLSNLNPDLKDIAITRPDDCQNYINSILKKNDALVAYGGYLEKRNLYSDKSSFTKHEAVRNIHLGIDFWTKAYTRVITPIKGKVHSFQNNTTIGDYGPTIILEHDMDGAVFYTLYGHLSLASIANIQIGQEFEKGSVLSTLGTPDINVNYAPHLHFQIIIDLEGKKGDYPGVCSETQLEFYKQNCPDPNLLLNL